MAEAINHWIGGKHPFRIKNLTLCDWGRENRALFDAMTKLTNNTIINSILLLLRMNWLNIHTGIHTHTHGLKDTLESKWYMLLRTTGGRTRQKSKPILHTTFCCN